MFVIVATYDQIENWTLFIYFYGTFAKIKFKRFWIVVCGGQDTFDLHNVDIQNAVLEIISWYYLVFRRHLLMLPFVPVSIKNKSLVQSQRIFFFKSVNLSQQNGLNYCIEKWEVFVCLWICNSMNVTEKHFLFCLSRYIQSSQSYTKKNCKRRSVLKIFFWFIFFMFLEGIATWMLNMLFTTG